MKPPVKILGVAAILLIVGMWLMPQQATAQHVSVSFQLFYDELSPYGMWVDYPNYGYVWIPNEDPRFIPYATAGHWVLTDEGWAWVSDYPWGWATFHYGRWFYDDAYGWIWVPGEEWGPAWVVWRRAPGYYGWVPLKPGISVSVAVSGNYHEPNIRWIFVRDVDIASTDIGHHVVDPASNNTIIKKSTVIAKTQKDSKHNVTFISGPDRNDVQKETHVAVKSVAIREDDKPGHHVSGDELKIYRPQVQQKGQGKNPVPSKVMKLEDVKPKNAEKKNQPSKPKADQDEKPKKKE